MPARIVLFAQRFPPAVGGTPTVLRNLLAGFPADRLAVVTQAPMDKAEATEWCPDIPKARVSQPPNLVKRFDPEGKLLARRVATTAERLLGESPPQAVLTVFPRHLFLRCGLAYAKKKGCPFVPYFMDTCADAARHPRARRAATALERRVFERASWIYALSEPLADHFRSKYPTADVRVLPHAVPAPRRADPQSPTQDALGTAPDRPRIVFTGQIHQTCLDAIHLLIEAIERMSTPRPLLVLSTPDPAHRLAAMNIRETENVRLVFLPDAASVAALQGSADILFNPVAFHCPAEAQLETLFPTKTVEYLRAGAPVLVLGPQKAAFVRYAANKGFATVVDRPDVEVIARTIGDMLQHPEKHRHQRAVSAEIAARDGTALAAQLLQDLDTA